VVVDRRRSLCCSADFSLQLWSQRLQRRCGLLQLTTRKKMLNEKKKDKKTQR